MLKSPQCPCCAAVTSGISSCIEGGGGRLARDGCLEGGPRRQLERGLRSPCQSQGLERQAKIPKESGSAFVPGWPTKPGRDQQPTGGMGGLRRETEPPLGQHLEINRPSLCIPAARWSNHRAPEPLKVVIVEPVCISGLSTARRSTLDARPSSMALYRCDVELPPLPGLDLLLGDICGSPTIVPSPLAQISSSLPGSGLLVPSYFYSGWAPDLTDLDNEAWTFVFRHQG